MKWMRLLKLGLFDFHSSLSLHLFTVILASIIALKHDNDDVKGDDDCYNCCRCYYFLAMIMIMMM